MSFYNHINNLVGEPDDERAPYFLLSRYVIECPTISIESKGFYAMYIAEIIEWDDIPFTNREELYSVPNFEEVGE